MMPTAPHMAPTLEREGENRFSLKTCSQKRVARSVRRRGEFVQIPRRVDLRTQHRVQTIWRLCCEHGVIEHAGSVDDGGQRMLGRYPGQECLQRISVRRIARFDPYRSTELGQRPCLRLRLEREAVPAAPSAARPFLLTSNRLRAP